MTRQPVAYLRRSDADDGSPGDVSRAVQERAIAVLAAADGFTGPVPMFVDWDKSADEAKIEKRTEYARMLAEVQAGRVTDIYAYAMDRLHRSTVLTGQLMRACVEHHVRIVTEREGEVSEATPDKWLQVTIRATFSEYELRVMKARARANTDRRIARGDFVGGVPYGSMVVNYQLVDCPEEDVSAVVEAYERTGAFLAAAKLLNTDSDLRRRAPMRAETQLQAIVRNPASTPARRAKAETALATRSFAWSENVVGRVVRRAGAAPPKGEQGVAFSRAPTNWRLYRLLRCGTDGSRMIAQSKANPRYFCGVARRDPNHPTPAGVAEAIVLRWLKAQVEEAFRYRISLSATKVSKKGQRAREVIKQEQEDLGWAVVNRLIGREKAQPRVDALEVELAALDDGTDERWVPAKNYGKSGSAWVDWDAPSGELGAELRSLIKEIKLDAHMRPIEVIWQNARWNAR
jgi:DNA invertase Pin-like site-specific DNA recombinase